jgi:hypothetical protein
MAKKSINRKEALERILSESQIFSSFAETDIWLTVKNKIENEIIKPAMDAFHVTTIDGKSNDELVRNMMSQRSAIKTAQRIIGFIENHKITEKQARVELEKIEIKLKSGGK